MPTDLDRLLHTARSEAGTLFRQDRPIIAARAPGWIDLIGGAASVGGSLALGWPLGQGTLVALQPAAQPELRIRVGPLHEYTVELDDLQQPNGTPRSYAEVAERLAERPALARLAAAAWLALLREEFARFPGGATLLLRPSEGPGAEVGIVAAVAQALVSAFGLHLAPRELGLAVQVGVAHLGDHDPGALGALVSVCAHAGALLQLHQQPAWIWGDLQLPPGAAIWAVRLGEGSAPAAETRLAGATAMALTLAAEALGLDAAQADERWLGYLSNQGTARYEARVRQRLPEWMRGAAFLERYPAPSDLLIDPALDYPVRAAAALAVEEHLRARMVAALLRAAASKTQRDEDLHLVGELLARSHGGQRAAGLGDPQADELVELIAAEGGSKGLYGARAVAAASGATLVALGRGEAEMALRELVASYGRAHGLAVHVFGGTSAGAAPSGTREG